VPCPSLLVYMLTISRMNYSMWLVLCNNVVSNSIANISNFLLNIFRNLQFQLSCLRNFAYEVKVASFDLCNSGGGREAEKLCW
jgi:hypothetical protein